jgi:hypothetical protein
MLLLLSLLLLTTSIIACWSIPDGPKFGLGAFNEKVPSRPPTHSGQPVGVQGPKSVGGRRGKKVLEWCRTRLGGSRSGGGNLAVSPARSRRMQKYSRRQVRRFACAALWSLKKSEGKSEEGIENERRNSATGLYIIFYTRSRSLHFNNKKGRVRYLLRYILYETWNELTQTLTKSKSIGAANTVKWEAKL